MSKICTGTGYDIDHCRVEKMGCSGCDHYREGGECNEQKISKCPKNKSN
jgi:hypothetical protein